MALTVLKRDYDHHTEQIHAVGGPSVRDVILGLNDGLVASFAVTSGVAGAFNVQTVVIMAGLSGMFGGGGAVGVGADAFPRAQFEFYKSEIVRERNEIARWPDRERDEVSHIYRKKGFSGPLLDQIVSHITAEPARWASVMMREELGFGDDIGESPRRSGITVGVSYLLGAMVPVMPYLLVAPPIGIVV